MASFNLMPEDEAESGTSYRLPGVVRPQKTDWERMSMAQRHSYIADFFEQQGATKSAALGIADALRGESRLERTIVNPKSGAIGLAQDLGPRKEALLSQRDWSNPDVQLRNMLREVTGGDPEATRHWAEIRQAPRDDAKQLWSKHFERPEATSGYQYTRSGYGAPGWNVAPNAIESEQNRSNTDVRLMTPEEYLSLLPPIEDSRAARAKKQNLRDSLAAGDDIEAIPSLDVTPRGDNLVVADWDGRNRAQSAIDAGVNEIPVSIRGVPRERQNEFKLLVGNKKVSLPYTFVEVPKPAAPAPPVPPSAAVQARQIVPQAFAPGPTAPQVPQAPAPLVPPASKPDFYPEIAAGINKDIVNPAGIGYRGVGVPDEATNATAGGRIAAANASSAGRIGLGGAIGSALSALNPIGSAQAAEPTPAEPAFKLMPETGGGAGTAPGAPDFSLMRSQAPSSFIPGMDTVAPPLANALFSLPTALAGAMIGAYKTPGNISSLTPQQFRDWMQKSWDAQAKMQIPETPYGHVISNILNSPAMLFALGINAVASQNIGGVTPERVEAAAPYMWLGGMALPFGAYSGGRVANALTAPSRAVLGRVLQTPEMRAATTANQAFRKELQRGGRSASDIERKIAEARRLGVPAAVIDYAIPAGPLDKELKRVTEHSAEAAGQTEKTLEERVGGPEVPSTTRLAAGGTRARMELETGREFGLDSSYELGREVRNKLVQLEQDKIKIEKELGKVTAARRDKLETQLTGLSPSKELVELRNEANSLESRKSDVEREIKRQKSNEDGLRWGGGILKGSVKPEEIRAFVASASPESIRHLRAAVADTLVSYYRDNPGKEPFKIADKPQVQNKIIEALGGSPRRAADFIDSAKAEALLLRRGENFLSWLRRDTTLPERMKRALYRAMEAVTHFGSGFLLGHHLWSGPYWGIRAARQLAELGLEGRAMPRTKSQEIARMLVDPNVELAPTGRGLFAIPQRPEMVPNVSGRAQLGRLAGKSVPAMVRSARSQESINALARASLPFMYGAFALRPQAEIQQ